MLVLWDFPFPSSPLQPQDLTASKKALETTLDLCPERRKLCGWRHESGRLILGSTAQHMMLLPNFGEVSGYSNQLPFAECLGSRRFAAVPFHKEHFPHHHCGQQHSFHQHAELRKVTARYGSTGATGAQEGMRQGWEDMGAAPKNTFARPFLKVFIFQNIQFIYNCSVYSFTYKFIPNL